MILWVLTHAAIAAAFALCCHGVGDLLLRRASIESNALRLASSTALGYGVIAQALFFLTWAGVLTRTNVIVVFVLAALCGLAAVPRLRSVRIDALTMLVAVGSLPSLVIAFYPPLGYDATMYHLVYARLFAEHGRLVFADALRFPVFPQLGEMHYAAMLVLFGDDRAAQLTQWIALPVTAVGTAVLVRQAGGGERAALFAAALWLGTPYAIYLAGTAYIDVSLTMFVTLAIASSASALSGAFAGMAAATKYHGLFFVAALTRRRSVVPYVLMAALLAGPWYAHIARTTGNPVFPFLAGIFGDHEYRTRVDRSLARAIDDPRAAATAVMYESPFETIVRKAMVVPMHAGMAPHSPLLVLLLPLAIAGAAIAPRLRAPLLVAGVYALIVSPLDWRFMIVIVPICAAGIALALERLLPDRRVALALIAPGFVWGMLLIVAKYGAIPHSDATRDAFLSARMAGYRAVRALGAKTVYVMKGPNLAYYCPGKCLGDTNGPHRFALVEPLLGDPPRLAAQLRRFGATHLVVIRSGTSFTPAPPFRLVYADPRVEGYEIVLTAGEPPL